MHFRSILAAPVVLLLAQTALARVIALEPNAVVVPGTYEGYAVSNSTQELESRQVGQAAEAVIQSITTIISSIQDGIAQDKINRSEFTKNLVAQLYQEHRNFNWIVCHTQHTTKFDGKRGVDWDHRHQEFDVKIGGTVGYEIYNLKSGEFTRQGDGGYLNWAFIGQIAKSDQGGKHLVFKKP